MELPKWGQAQKKEKRMVHHHPHFLRLLTRSKCLYTPLPPKKQVFELKRNERRARTLCDEQTQSAERGLQRAKKQKQWKNVIPIFHFGIVTLFGSYYTKYLDYSIATRKTTIAIIFSQRLRAAWALAAVRARLHRTRPVLLGPMPCVVVLRTPIFSLPTSSEWPMKP